MASLTYWGLGSVYWLEISARLNLSLQPNSPDFFSLAAQGFEEGENANYKAS